MSLFGLRKVATKSLHVKRKALHTLIAILIAELSFQSAILLMHFFFFLISPAINSTCVLIYIPNGRFPFKFLSFFCFLTIYIPHFTLCVCVCVFICDCQKHHFSFQNILSATLDSTKKKLYFHPSGQIVSLTRSCSLSLSLSL